MIAEKKINKKKKRKASQGQFWEESIIGEVHLAVVINSTPSSQRSVTSQLSYTNKVDQSLLDVGGISRPSVNARLSVLSTTEVSLVFMELRCPHNRK